MKKWTMMYIIMLVMTMNISIQADEPVTVGFGSLKIGGVFQTTYNWYEDDAAASQFKVKRARLIFSGVLVPDKAKFFVQADAVQTPYLLDTKLLLYYLPKTEVSIGRMVPNFTLYMPLSTAKLDFINYPLTTVKYGMFRQTGVQLTATLEKVDLGAGAYNGYVTEAGSVALKGDDWGDKNDSKDFLAFATLKPIKGMKLGLFGWIGKPYDLDAEEDFNADRFGANIDWQNESLHLAAEYVMGKTEYSDGSDVDSYAFMAQAGYALCEKWEIMGRYDFYDGNTDVDDNAESWVTGGINYSLAKINTKFYLNYIAKMEEGEELDNDEIVIQAQYSF